MPTPLQTEIMPTTYPRAIEVALRLLEREGLLAFPTDTVYGVGALPFLPRAVARIHAAKGRPLTRAIPILLDGATSLEQVCQDIPDEARVLAAEFWPGPLTIVLKRKPAVPDVVTAGGATVAVRVPDNPFTLRLIEAAGGALAATSANLSGRPDAVTAQEVLAYLGGRIELILDGGPCPGGIPSTVVDLTGKSPQIVRKGAISLQQVERELARRP
jgi:L-threonylcarbamoyladenylate synthase